MEWTYVNQPIVFICQISVLQLLFFLMMLTHLFCNWVSPVSSGWKSKVCTSELISPSLHFRARTGGNSNNNHGMWTDNISVRPMIQFYSTLTWGEIMRNHEFVEKQPVILFLLGFCKFLRWYVLGKKNVYPKLFNSQSISNV